LGVAEQPDDHGEILANLDPTQARYATMAVMAANGALGPGARYVACPLSYVSPTDEGVSLFSVLETRLRQPGLVRFEVINQIKELCSIQTVIILSPLLGIQQ